MKESKLSALALEPSPKGLNARARYYLKHREAINMQLKQYRLENKETIKHTQRQYYLRNQEALKERQRQYRALHKDTQQFRLKNNQAAKLYRLHNKQSIAEFQKQYYEKYKGDIKESRRQYYTTYKDVIKRKQKEYRERNKEVVREAVKRYQRDNKGAVRETQRLYRLNNKEAIREMIRKWNQKFKKPRKLRIWKDPDQVRIFFELASTRLYVREPVEWYRISYAQMSEVGGSSLYSIFGSLGKALKYAFPSFDWDLSKFSLRGKKSRQRWLRVTLEQILPEKTDLYEDYLHPSLFWDESRYKMELDIWIPKYKVALEYQGEHHYHDLFSVYGPSGTLSLYNQRDLRKKEACSKEGITLVTIPYWWDGRKESLAATLYQACPDIFPRTHLPQIPISPPQLPTKRDSKDSLKIQSFLMHGGVWNEEDPTGWYMSEKLDGFRAFWDGSKLYSKNGNLLPIPLEFTRSFPRGVSLDGELWTGYDDFNKLHIIMRKATVNLENPQALQEIWNDVKFCVFDAPMHPGNYLERHTFASKSIDGPNISIIPIATCLGLTHLQTMLNEITVKKGEGIMLYHPTSIYTSGRTNNLLKVKPSAEEDVNFIKINPNSYSFLCKQKNGVECIVKCSGWDYSFPPSPGTILRVKHNGFNDTSQKMKSPYLLRVRSDLTLQ